MKVKAIVTFKDLKEKKIRKAGQKFDITEERYEEILKKGKYVEPVEEKTEETKTARKSKTAKEKVEGDL